MPPVADVSQLDNDGLAIRLEDLLKRGANRYPARTAVTYLHNGVYKHLSYEQLNDKAHSLATFIERQTGFLTAGDTPFVGIFLPRSVGQVVAILATLIAGAAYVPIALDSTVPNFRTIIDQTRARLIITESAQEPALASLLSQADCEGVVTVDVSEADRPQQNNVSRPPKHFSATCPAYVLFSSGTTGMLNSLRSCHILLKPTAGTPKGVVTSHSAVQTYCAGANAFYRATPADRWVRAAAYTFDSSIDEMFCPVSLL
jgi:non-ribosomal peptide synthetase component F